MNAINCRARLSYLESLFSRSCLESAPARVERAPVPLFGATRSSSRAHSQLHQLKRNLLRTALDETPEPRLFKRLCGAANQAAELAWATDFPLLVFPGLFEELIRAVRMQVQPEAGWPAQTTAESVPADAVPGFAAAAPVSDQPGAFSAAAVLPVLSMAARA